jgi:hypothetical protein
VSYSEILRKRTDDDQRQQDERMLDQASKEQQDKVKTEFRDIKNKYARLQELYNDIEPVLKTINFTLGRRNKIQSFYRNIEIQDVMSKKSFDYLLSEIFNMKDKDADYYQKQLSNSIGRFAMSTPDGSFTLDGTDESTVSVGELGKNLKELANSEIDGVPFEKAISFIYRKTFGQQLIRSREELREKRQNLKDMKKLVGEIGKTRRTGRRLPKDFKDVDIRATKGDTYAHKTEKDKDGRPKEISEKEYKNLNEEQQQEYKRKDYLEGDVAELDDKFAISTAKKLVEQIEKNFAPTTYKGFEEFNLLGALPENPEEYIRKKFNNLRDTLESEIQSFLLNTIETSKTIKKERKVKILTYLSTFTDRFNISEIETQSVDKIVDKINFDDLIVQAKKNRQEWLKPKKSGKVSKVIKQYEKVVNSIVDKKIMPTNADLLSDKIRKSNEESSDVLIKAIAKVFEEIPKRNELEKILGGKSASPLEKATSLVTKSKKNFGRFMLMYNAFNSSDIIDYYENFQEQVDELLSKIKEEIELFPSGKEQTDALVSVLDEDFIEDFLNTIRDNAVESIEEVLRLEKERYLNKDKYSPSELRKNISYLRENIEDDGIKKQLDDILASEVFRMFLSSRVKSPDSKGRREQIKESFERTISEYKKYELSQDEKIKKARKLLKDMFSQPNDDDPEFKQNSEVAIKVREYEEKFIGVLEAYNELIVNNDVAEIATVKDTLKQLSIFVKDPREIELKPLNEKMFTYDKEKVLRKIITKINAITDTTGLVGRKSYRTSETVSEKRINPKKRYNYSLNFSQKVFDTMFDKDNFEEQIINHLEGKVFTTGIFPSLKPTADALVRQVKELVEYDIQERIPLGPLREGEERDLNLNEQIKGVIRRAIERTKEGITKLENKNTDDIERLSKGEGIERAIRNVIASRNNLISQFVKDIEELEKYIGE